MNQYVPYGYYDPYSPRSTVGQSGPTEQHGHPGSQPGVGTSNDPGAGTQGNQPQQPARSPPSPPQQGQGRGATAPGPGAQSQPPGRMQTGASGASGPPPAAGAGPQGGPAPQGPAPGGPQTAPGGGPQPPEPVTAPLVDVLESAEELVVIADLPGFEEEDITIQADDTTLVIRAHREDDHTDDYQVRSTERPRRLERVMQFPPNGDIDGASATHDNGVCTVTIPIDGPDKREIGFH